MHLTMFIKRAQNKNPEAKRETQRHCLQMNDWYKF